MPLPFSNAFIRIVMVSQKKLPSKMAFAVPDSEKVDLIIIPIKKTDDSLARCVECGAKTLPVLPKETTFLMGKRGASFFLLFLLALRLTWRPQQNVKVPPPKDSAQERGGSLSAYMTIFLALAPFRASSQATLLISN